MFFVKFEHELSVKKVTQMYISLNVLFLRHQAKENLHFFVNHSKTGILSGTRNKLRHKTFGTVVLKYKIFKLSSSTRNFLQMSFSTHICPVL